MLMTLEGVYHNGQIELAGLPDQQFDDTPVLVTFLAKPPKPLQTFNLTETEAAELRARLMTFAADWDQPEMAIYDDYDTIKSSVSSR